MGRWPPPLHIPLSQQAKTEEQIAAEEAWYETEKVWLVHRDGFSLGESAVSPALLGHGMPHPAVAQ